MNTIKIHDLYFEPYLAAKDIQQKVDEMGVALTKRFQGKNPLFIAILNGSYIFAADLTRACSIDCEISFIRLSSYSGTGSTGVVNTLIGLQEEVKDRDVIIIEDIVDTGTTMEYFLDELKQKNPASVTLVTLLLKEDVFQNRFPVDVIGFKIPNRFVVGYGLDYDGHGRNLKAIYQKIG